MKELPIKFGSIHPHMPLPKPAKAFVPEWYRASERFYGTDGPERMPSGLLNKSMKLCVPLLDGLTSGYMAVLAQDILVKQNPLRVTWQSELDAVHILPLEAVKHFPIPDGHVAVGLAWCNHTLIKTPPGYSSVISHPINRFDLPFTTLTGIADTDWDQDPESAVPFFIKEGFEGIIPQGTPIYQILPFKREAWYSEESEDVVKKSLKEKILARRVSYGRYKSAWWHKKRYN